nr:hypothetical protein [Pandoravirus massiliensis]
MQRVFRPFDPQCAQKNLAGQNAQRCRRRFFFLFFYHSRSKKATSEKKIVQTKKAVGGRLAPTYAGGKKEAKDRAMAGAVGGFRKKKRKKKKLVVVVVCVTHWTNRKETQVEGRCPTAPCVVTVSLFFSLVSLWAGWRRAPVWPVSAPRRSQKRTDCARAREGGQRRNGLWRARGCAAAWGPPGARRCERRPTRRKGSLTLAHTHLGPPFVQPPAHA